MGIHALRSSSNHLVTYSASRTLEILSVIRTDSSMVDVHSSTMATQGKCHLDRHGIPRHLVTSSRNCRQADTTMAARPPTGHLDPGPRA